jgi:CRP-like cAMP-binding protein
VAELPDFLKFKQFIHAQGNFSTRSWDLLETIIERHELSRGEFSIKEGQVCRFIDFISSGSFRLFYDKDGTEITTALFVEGVCVTDMKSLSQQTPSHLNLVANEKSTIVRLYKEKLISLYDESPELQALGRTILESMVVNESGWKEMYTLYDPTDRYRFLMKKAPEFILRFPMQQIASFLGIRRETLSRIRGKYQSESGN